MHPGRKPCRHADPSPAPAFDRRGFLQATAAVAGLAALGPAAAQADEGARPDPNDVLGLPGRYPGRVVEVRDPGAVHDGVPDADAVGRMVQTGMTRLTGIPEPAEAWRSLFEPGDV